METTPIKCTRDKCQNNESGVCKLKAPLLDKKEAYTSCLDHVNKTE